MVFTFLFGLFLVWLQRLQHKLLPEEVETIEKSLFNLTEEVAELVRPSLVWLNVSDLSTKLNKEPYVLFILSLILLRLLILLPQSKTVISNGKQNMPYDLTRVSKMSSLNRILYTSKHKRLSLVPATQMKNIAYLLNVQHSSYSCLP